MKKGDRRQETAGGAWVETMMDLLKGGVLACVTAILILLMCALLISVGAIRERWMHAVVLIACMVGAWLGGNYAVTRGFGRPILKGVGVGAILFLILITAGFLVYDTASIEQGGLGILISAICGGALSSFTGRQRKKKRRRS